MKPFGLRFRQVHLDFHTHQSITGIGKAFDAEAFADTLEQARVNSINLFARCHHGYIYYRSKVFAHLMHPHLQCDLLREQIKALHVRGIRTPIYITVKWDQLTAEQHPEWRILDENGVPRGTPPNAAGFYRPLCLNSPYAAWLKTFVQDVLNNLPVDGLWFDIVFPDVCSCRFCRNELLERGLDPARAEDRERQSLEVIDRFRLDMTRFVRKINKTCQIIYNAGHIGPSIRSSLPAFTHLELESLPGGGWGYLHFPVTARYARTLGKDILGMTGKFHSTWGDFHSFKNPAALEYECFTAASQAAACSVGDQLHPDGELCPHTYNLIGSVYRQIEAREPWLAGARAATEIGVFTPEEFEKRIGGIAISKTIQGVTRILQEGQHQFDILDSRSSLDGYKLIILPDTIPLAPDLARKLSAYLKTGGALLANFRSGLDPEGKAFALPQLGVRYEGEAPFEPDFLVPEGALGTGLPSTEHVMYKRGVKVMAIGRAKVLAMTVTPYFNRTWRHFCSHQHAPSSRKKGYPAAVRNGRVIYLAHPVFEGYATNSPLWYKRLVLNAVEMLLPEPMVRIDGPSTLTSSVTEQPGERRHLLHLLHYIPVRRGEAFDVIEEAMPLSDLPVSVNLNQPVKRVICQPEGTELAFTAKKGRIEFRLPRLNGYQIIALEYGQP